MRKLLPLAFALLLLLTACAATSAENKPYELTYQDVVYAGTYTGSIQDKLPNGEGTFTFDDGTNVFTYTGTWSEGKMSGSGKLVDSQFLIKFTENDRTGKYEGDTINGVPTGNGSFTATNSEGQKYCYTGNFKDGTFNGQGELKYEVEPDYIQTGTFTNGDYTPTPKETFMFLGQKKGAKFGMRQLSADFLDSNADIFVVNSAEGLDALVDTEYRHEAYTKSPDKFGDKLIKQTALRITQISEFSTYNYDTVTFIIAGDVNYNYYYIYYIGSVDAYDGDYISAYLLPLDYFAFDNVGGGKTRAVACAAAYITK
ncbi:MAG: hypothetical protein CVU91_13510 [Firmicutes bacterium HGW-Firmicutes-16]|nr:MAG: hypothetical protein CVU91_13510 [Firmicutes bacterium HGW-Firmicutes-16]